MKNSVEARSRRDLELTMAIRHHEWLYLKDTIRLCYFLSVASLLIVWGWLS